MAVESVPGSEVSGKTFYIPRRTFFIVLGWLFVLSGATGIAASRDTGPGFASIMTCLGGLVMLCWVYNSRLRITPEGVECGYELYRYKTTWDNVERIRTAPFGVFGSRKVPMDCLILRQPGGEVAGLLIFHASDEVRQMIPLGIYSKSWRDGEIGQAIREYAPHLLA